LMLTLAGTVTGVGAALLLTRVLAQLLFQIGPFDATSFASSVVLLGLISVAACVIPALRAAHLDPVDALRSE
jgi:putative ABC transport system permease protein